MIELLINIHNRTMRCQETHCPIFDYFIINKINN